MNIIVCLDDKGGMAFNGRRQSKDRALRAKMLELTKGKKLYMNSYSFSQFEERAENIVVCENFLKKASGEDFCFVENVKIAEDDITTLYAFRWNRAYPADMSLVFDLECVSSTEFKGFSHEKITLEEYKRRTV